MDFSASLIPEPPERRCWAPIYGDPIAGFHLESCIREPGPWPEKELEDFQKTGVPAKTKGSNWSSRTPYRNVFALLTRHGLPGRVTGLFFHPQIHSRAESRRCRGVTTAHSCQFTVVVILPVHTCPRKPCNPRRWRHTLRCTRTIKSYELVPVAVTLHTMVPPSTERGNAAARTLFSRRD